MKRLLNSYLTFFNLYCYHGVSTHFANDKMYDLDVMSSLACLVLLIIP